MKLVHGKDLTPQQVEQVKAAFIYRYTIDNPRNYQPAMATGATQTDTDWLNEYAFYIKNDGTLADRPRWNVPMIYKPEMNIIVNPKYRPQSIVIDDQPTFIISKEGASHGWKYAIPVWDQRIVAFPKFLTLGIGFEGGEWDLPYDCDVDEIWWMIKSDKGNQASEEDCLKAIRMLKEKIEADELEERQYSREEKRASEAFFDYNHGERS